MTIDQIQLKLIKLEEDLFNIPDRSSGHTTDKVIYEVAEGLWEVINELTVLRNKSNE